MADAPVPGLAMTRLIPTIGAHAAATLQERLTDRAVTHALAAATGPVTLWGAPNSGHDTFLTMVANRPITLRAQPGGDRGARTHAAVAKGPTLVIGTDCPALAPVHLRAAARIMNEGAQVVLIPSETGGYVLIGLRAPEPTLFQGIPWGTPKVLAETRARVIAKGLLLNELPPLWNLETEEDLTRLEREVPELSLTASE